MGVKCPKHNVELEIEYTKLNIMQNKYPVVTGQCPVCKIKYLSREIMSSSGSFKIGGQAYQYLSEMEMAYPHPFKPILQQTTTVAKESIAEQVIVPDPVPAPSLAQIDANKAAKDDVKVPKEQKKKKKSKKQKSTVAQNDLYKIEGEEVHIYNLSYPNSIRDFCPKDKERLYSVSRARVHSRGTEIVIKARCCLKCRTAYIPQEQHAKIFKLLLDAGKKGHSMVGSNISISQAALFSKPSGPVNLAIPENVLYVCKGIVACKRNGHTVESATGILIGRNGAVVKINTNYCPQCRKYFIGYDEYEHYRKIYGVLLGNIKVTNGSFVQSETELAEESILRICGYSVNQTSNLSAADRQRILQYLIDSRISSKAEIINYLTYFIRRNGKRSNMDEAVRRWNEDLKWVREYRINQQRYFEIANIQKFKH